MKLEDLCIAFKKPLKEENVKEFFTYVAGQNSVKIITIEETKQVFVGYNPQDVVINKPKKLFRFEAWCPWTMIPLEFYRNEIFPGSEYIGLRVDQQREWSFEENEADMKPFWPPFKEAVESYFSR